ncbi:NusG domain II-containing protein [Haloimpatiens sp. FM7330]|uniref:NusG domain II-containing protein n=1 Tax=Haloimpatiens sp. FM7330 TaxID=3298610 RepID=UPI00363AA228
MKKLDIIVVVSILLIAGIFLGFNKYKSIITKKNSSVIYAEISVKNKLYKKVPVSDNHKEVIKIETDLGKNIIKIHDNGVEMIEADCNDHICEYTGFIKEVGEIIVCLPHQVVVEIKGNTEGKVDEVSN